MEDLARFLSFEDPNVRVVVLGTLLVGASSGAIGAFMVLMRKSLLGDAISHSILPGICIAFMLYPVKNPYFLLLGAFVFGILSGLLVDYISNQTKLKSDAALGITLSLFFGLGIVLLTFIQHHYGAQQAGLESFLFGKAASLTEADVQSIAVVSAVIFIVLVLLFKEFRLLAFNRSFGESIGVPMRFLNGLLSALTVLAISIGIQSVGVVLMAALLIAPTLAALFWSNSLKGVIFLALIFGAFSGVFGSYISFVSPSMPTGPWIVLGLFAIVMVSMLGSKIRLR